MDVVSSTIMLITSRMAAKPKVTKYPVVSKYWRLVWTDPS